MPLIAPNRPKGQIGISGQKPKKTPRPAPKTYTLGAVGAFGMRENWVLNLQNLQPVDNYYEWEQLSTNHDYPWRPKKI